MPGYWNRILLFDEDEEEEIWETERGIIEMKKQRIL